MTTEVLSYFRLLLCGDFKNQEVNQIVNAWAADIAQIVINDISPQEMILDFASEEIWTLKFALISIITNYIITISKVGSDIFEELLQTFLNLFKIWKLKKNDLMPEIVKLINWCKEQVLAKFSNSDLRRSIVYLMIQPELANFPFEFIDTNIVPKIGWVLVESEQSFMRIPSIDTISRYLENSKKYPEIKSINKWYYLINPQGDLTTTESRLKEFCSENNTWKGIFGQKPSNEEQFYTDLKKSEMLLYWGHGIGLDIYSPLRLSRNKIKSGWLMFGCQSASNKYNGLLEMSNYFNYFFISGWPFFAGWLWDVIDKDIDKYTLSFMKTWFLESDIMMSKLRSKINQKDKENAQFDHKIDIEHLIIKSRQIAIKSWKYRYVF